MSWNTRCAILLLVFVLGCAGSLFAASQNAVIYGTVYNAGSNPMPDVTVILENRALGFSRTAVTGSDGSYTFSEVPPADNYTVTAKHGAKQIDQRTGITVNVGDERVILPPLTEQPEVAAGAPPKPAGPVKTQPTVRNETVSSAVSGVVTGDQLRSLPLYNRNFLVLGLITPNVHDTEQGSALTGASFSVAGARPSQNDFLLDGTDNLASSSNQAIPFQVNDSIQEFRVTSSTANAEYGRNLGGTVNVVTKRAGNAFHGSVYGYFGSDVLNADNPLSLYNGTTFDKAAAYAGTVGVAPVLDPTAAQYRTPFSYNQYVANAQAAGYCTNSRVGAFPANTCVANTDGLNTFFDPAQILKDHNQFKQPFDSKQFGASGGGALIKDKWFAFGSYEGTRIDNPNPILERVPSSFDTTYHGYPFASGLGAADPNFVQAQNILKLFPASNIKALGSGAVPGVLEFFQGETPNYTHVHNFLLRTDFKKSENTDFTFRYVGQILNQLHDDTLPAVGSYPGNGAFREAVNHNASLSFSHNFTKTLINELRFGYSRFDLGESAQDASFDATTLGLPFKQMPTILLNGIDTQSSGAAPGVLGAYAGWLDFGAGAPSLMFPWSDSRFPFARLGAPLGAPAERRDSTFSVTDNVSWNHGHHNIKFGGEFRHLDNDVFNGAFNRGLIYSGNIGEFTSDSESCNVGSVACPNNAFRRPSFDFAQFNPAYSGKFRSWVVAGYLQDTYRARKNLTFNYGLRYEYFSVPREINNNIWNFDPASNGMVQQNGTAVQDPYGNLCGAVDPPWGVLTAAFGGFPVQDSFGNPTWINGTGCKSTSTNGYNQTARSNTLNFAPRAGIAWNVRGDEVAHPTVVRVGFGIFYDQAPISQISQLMYNRPITSPNAIIGQGFSGQAGFPLGGACGGNYQCGFGNSLVQAGALAATTLDGVNPNSFYASMQQPFAIYARDTGHSNTPHSLQASASIQQQLSPKVTAEVGYVGMIGYYLPVVYDQNYANEWGHVRLCTGGVGSPTCPDASSPGSNLWFDNMSQFPIYTVTNRGDSNYHSVMARVRTAGWHGLRLNVAYSYSKSLDNSSTGIYPTLPISPRNLLLGYQFLENGSFPTQNLLGTFTGALPPAGLGFAQPVFPFIDFSTGALTTTGAGRVLTSPYLIPQDPFHFLANDYGRSDFDSTHRLTVDYVWETKSSSKLWDMWAFSGIFTAQTGQPFSIFGGPIAGGITQRAELGVPQNQILITDNPNGAIDPTQFIFLLSDVCPAQVVANNASTFMPIPGQACIGRTGRNAFIGPNFVNMNFAIQKGFTLGGEDKKLYLRAEFFNLFNRANFYNPISSISDNGFTPSGDFGTIKSAHDPRQIQLAVRFSW
ncbi:MAG: TonB-dependent receptor [Acidobacteriia bacterium]|nr:TonB-dependent receptor [Terriglobia bacterium]